MMVSYAMDVPSQLAAFEHDFPQLCCRMRTLQDGMISHFLRGELDCIVPYSYQPEGAPIFCDVTFEEAAAAKYEAFMIRFFKKFRNTRSSVLPRPSFPVRVVVDFGGGAREAFDFHFEDYSRETVLAFCEQVETRAAYLYRHRLSRIRR